VVEIICGAGEPGEVELLPERLAAAPVALAAE
jgi:hypothetical protein